MLGMKPKRCKKIRYKTEVDAKIALAFMPDKPKRKECRAYQCPKCRGFHLTSWEKAGKP